MIHFEVPDDVVITTKLRKCRTIRRPWDKPNHQLSKPERVALTTAWPPVIVFRLYIELWYRYRAWQRTERPKSKKRKVPTSSCSSGESPAGA